MCQFTKNGEKVGPLLYLEDKILCPTVAVASKSAELIANLGRDAFRYDIGIYSIFLYIIY